jgi:hypothetical protein
VCVCVSVCVCVCVSVFDSVCASVVETEWGSDAVRRSCRVDWSSQGSMVVVG